ncbi:unnamed protein product [Sphenostylis stenocarpa]|uniref:Prephenate dehydratase domain-containing protein n=1 Tax=Sphenostylis stenocarpa TaxID=92480 RepID=A0AA86VZA5_9FABA|nr:unnamed protein product [Sphenostylis stenocarpa]
MSVKLRELRLNCGFGFSSVEIWPIIDVEAGLVGEIVTGLVEGTLMMVDISVGVRLVLLTLSLQKQLSANDFSSRDGSKVPVAYKGFPGAYSEDAALEAYPKLEGLILKSIKSHSS